MGSILLSEKLLDFIIKAKRIPLIRGRVWLDIPIGRK